VTAPVFSCPNCGSGHYSADERFATCHDEYGRGCTYQGPNWQAFLIHPEGEPGFRRPVSEAEFRRVDEEWLASTKHAAIRARQAREPQAWVVHIECSFCGASFTVENPDYSREVLGERTRAVLIWVPQECPACHNIRVVSER